jgi:glutamine synthetase
VDRRERQRAGIVPLPSTRAQREQALLGSERVTAALGDHLLGAFLAVRRSNAEWAADRTLEEVVTGHSGSTDTHAPRSRPT